jgi:hypothetical protein
MKTCTLIKGSRLHFEGLNPASLFTYYYDLNVYALPKNLYVEILTPMTMVLEGGAFGGD